MNLRDLQSDFQRIVLGPECVDADWVKAGTEGPVSQQRLAIYHNAYRVRLIDVLLDTFEHTAAYLGDDWFQKLAADYVQTNDSRHSNIGLYGRAFPVFLAEKLTQDLEVSELALMDWTLRRAFDGADSPVMTAAHLQQVATGERVMDYLRPVPTLGVVRHQFNTLDIWQAINQEQQPPVVECLPQSVDVLTWRKGHSPHFRSLSPVEAVAIAGICEGEDLESIGTKLTARFPELDAATEFGHMLHRWIDDQILVMPSD